MDHPYDVNFMSRAKPVTILSNDAESPHLLGMQNLSRAVMEGQDGMKHIARLQQRALQALKPVEQYSGDSSGFFQHAIKTGFMFIGLPSLCLLVWAGYQTIHGLLKYFFP